MVLKLNNSYGPSSWIALSRNDGSQPQPTLANLQLRSCRPLSSWPDPASEILTSSGAASSSIDGFPGHIQDIAGFKASCGTASCSTGSFILDVQIAAGVVSCFKLPAFGMINYLKTVITSFCANWPNKAKALKCELLFIKRQKQNVQKNSLNQ